MNNERASVSKGVKENVLGEEFELSAFMRQTMFSSAIFKDGLKFNAFCSQLIMLPHEKRFSFAFKFFESIEGFPKIELKLMKSSFKALEFKNLGNTAFVRGNFVEALKLYTKSVAVAPVDSPDLAVAYGNRSAVLLELQRYEACLVDINRALNENFPEASKLKLLNRREKCRSKMIELHAAELDNQKLTKKFDRKMKKFCPIDEDTLDLNYTGKFLLPKAKLKNKSISNASEKIEFKVNSSFGRHIIAAKDIQIGEIIGMEKAYASVLFNTHQYSHCANCFLRCEALIPCPECNAVMYCSRCCREEHFNRSHRIECQIYFYSYCLSLPLTTSLRLAIQALMVVTRQGENLKELMKDPLTKNPMKLTPNTVPKKLCSQNAVHIILSLLNDDRLFAYPHDLFTLSEAALSLYRVIVFVHILRQTTYFDAAMVGKAQADNDSTKEREYVGLLFLKLMVSLPRYSLGVEELLQEKVSEIFDHYNGQTTVGSGFYLFHSFFSHSCNMNVIGSLYRDTMVSQAIQPIKAGQQLFFNYGPNFLMVPRKERQNELRRDYQFKCCCEACQEEWPLIWEMEMSNDYSSLLNSETNMSQYYVEEVNKFYTNPLLLIEHDTYSFNSFCKYLTMCHKKFKKLPPDYFFASIVFQLLLQSRGNNYVYTRDKVLMSL